MFILFIIARLYKNSHTNVILMGDFNARTATVDDIAIPDTHF